MPDDMPCPPAESLEAFALGRTNDAEAAFVETHLGICPRCVERIASVSADPLLLAVKSGWPVDEDPEDLELAARLRQALPPAGLSGTTDGSLQAPTVIHTPGEEQAQSDDTEDWLGIFSSPAESGEIGRLGPYRVLDRLGHGGMGVVFRAEDSRLQRPVALKIMRPRRAASNDSIQRFLAEARAAAALKHDHVVTIYEVGDDGGSPYIAMELLEGESLENRLARDHRLSVAEVCRIGAETASALSAAHVRGLVHRDIKPANLWLEAGTGRTKVLDFGLVRMTATDAHVTTSGTIVGTPAYMAPEQARGEAVDGRTDLFALGVVLYRAITGANPFRGRDSISTLVAVATESPTPPHSIRPEMPRRLSDLVMRLLSKKPEERPDTAEAVVAELISIRAQEGERAAPLGGTNAQITPLPRVMAALVALTILLAAVVVIVRDREGNKVAEFVVPPDGSLELREGGPSKDTPTLSPQVLTAPATATVAADEPPPLDAWLKGRTVLTVSQDGTGQYRTIQGALDQLRPGQAIQIQDRGPYRENLKVTDLPRDTGLFSTCQTIIECPGWQDVYKEPPNPSGQETQVYSGHILTSPKGFRLHGVEWRFASRGGRTIQPLTLLETTGLILEQCVFRATDGDDVQFVNVTNLGLPNPPAASIVVRDCLFESQLWLNSRGENSRFLVERNLFAGPSKLGCLVVADSRTNQLIVRQNVFLGQTAVPMLTIARPLVCEDLRIVNNTFDSASAMQFVGPCPSGGAVSIRNNIHTGNSWFVIVTEEVKDSVAAYLGQDRLGQNAYTGPLTGPSELPAKIVTTGDYRRRIPWLSSSPDNPDYLRIAAEVMASTLPGAGGELAIYRGALPPGSAPQDGDWFTRLMGRWKASSPSSAPGSDVVDRLSKSPPLEEWLKGRTILTVSQDGKGQFSTIQAALDQVASGQAIEVLDHGPYHERLNATLPADCGLFSRVQTIVDFEDWEFGWPGDIIQNGVQAKVYLGYDFHMADRFRLHGFDFHFPSPKGTYEEGHIHQRLMVRTPRLSVIENCRFGRSGRGCYDGEPIMFSNWDHATSAEMSVVMRDCFVDGTIDVNTSSQKPFPPEERKVVILFEHNVFPGTGVDHHVLVAGHTLQNLTVRECLFSGSVAENLVLNNVSEVAAITVLNCYLNGNHGIYFGNTVPDSRVTVRNNLRSGEGIVNFGATAGQYRDHAQSRWTVTHNAYAMPRKPNVPPVCLRSDPTDVTTFIGPTGTSLDSSDAFRLKPNDRLATAGAGGGAPSYIGPLPPGPEPREGDWFTRLRERWFNKTSATSRPSGVSLAEPPPLEEWLKGRTVLTVSQDGKGDFSSIQAALDALRPGQAVKVLDKGPYKESLKLEKPPEDIGLVSVAQTTLEVTELRDFRNDNSKYDTLVGQLCLSPNGFRLSGFEVVGTVSAGTRPLALLDIEGGARLTIEDCRFRFRDTDGSTNPAVSAIRLNGLGQDEHAPLVIRDCVLNGSVWVNGWPGMVAPPVLVLRNYMETRSPGYGMLFNGQLRRTHVRFNVVTTSGKSMPFIYELDSSAVPPELVEVVHNTFVGPGKSRFLTSAPRAGVMIRNNILPVVQLGRGAERQQDVIKNWEISGNLYPIQPESIPEDSKFANVYRRPDDPPITPKFLSEDPQDKNFARLAAMDGIGSAGALAAGATPERDDWFTRLRERWGGLNPEDSGIPSNSTNTRIPAHANESPPLEDWLEGRTVLTVSQDGNGQFQSIQTALEALKPGQAVQVLDRGPYRETLLAEPPADTALFSKVQTVIELPDWTPAGWKERTGKGDQLADIYLGHRLRVSNGFRLHGFDLRFPDQVGEYDDGKWHRRMSFRMVRGVVLENCLIRGPGNRASDIDGAPLEISGWDLEDSPEMSAVIRDCVIEGSVVFTSSSKLAWSPGQRGANLLVARSWFSGRGLDHHVLVSAESLERLTVRDCLFTGQAAHDLIVARGAQGTSVEVAHCYLDSFAPMAFTEAIPRGEVVLRNNLRNGAGVACFMGNAEMFADEAEGIWRVAHNAHQFAPDRVSKPRLLKRADSDIALRPKWLSLDVSNRDAFRLSADDPLGKAGTDGAHIGPFPAGPAPADGDWFTRLQERRVLTEQTPDRK